MHSRLVWAFFALPLLCSPALADERPAGHQRLGEAYTWKMRILGLFDAGRARLAIAPPRQSGNLWQMHVVGEAEATGIIKALTGLHDDYRLILDAYTLLPRKLEIQESGFRTRTIEMQLDGQRFELYAHKPGAEVRFSGRLPSEPLEPIGVLLMLRAARLGDGDSLQLIVMDGSNFYQGTIEVQGREALTTSMGNFRTIKLHCQGERVDSHGAKIPKPPRQATLWLSDDALRIPLRIEVHTDYGTGQFELTSFEPAQKPLPIPKRLFGVIERLRPAPNPPSDAQ